MNKLENVKLNKINSIYDGDTFRATINGYPDWLGNNVPFRIYGIDTPEKGWRAKCEYESELSIKALDFVKSMVDNGKDYRVNIYGRGSRGRILAELLVDDVNIGTELIEKGLAVPYNGKTKPSWC